jgi:hypothetical protein
MKLAIVKYKNAKPIVTLVSFTIGKGMGVKAGGERDWFAVPLVNLLSLSSSKLMVVLPVWHDEEKQPGSPKC